MWWLMQLLPVKATPSRKFPVYLEYDLLSVFVNAPIVWDNSMQESKLPLYLETYSIYSNN